MLRQLSINNDDSNYCHKTDRVYKLLHLYINGSKGKFILPPRDSHKQALTRPNIQADE